MNLFVIITPSAIYATYHKTICCKIEVSTDEKHISDAIDRCKISVFDYAATFWNVNVGVVKLEEAKTDNDIFTYLDKVN